MNTIRLPIAILLALVCSLAGCLPTNIGEYYPPEVSVDQLGIARTDLESSDWYQSPQDILADDFDKYRVFRFPETTELDPPEDRFRYAGDNYFYSRMVTFNDRQLKIAIPLKKWVSIMDSTNRIVRKLELPRYSTDVHAFEIVFAGHRYLVVGVSQHFTSNTSTLFILDDEFDIVYKEHLLAAHWIAAPKDPNHSRFILSTDLAWVVDGERVIVGGPWLYSLAEDKTNDEADGL